MREQLKELWAVESQPTINDLVVRATVLALAAHPQMNATLDAAGVSRHADINVGLAVDVDAGLIVPVIQRAGGLSLKDLARQTKELGARARDNRLTPDDVQGGTFTITNLGSLGIDFFTPIINPPQVAILGVGRVFDKLVLVDGELEQRSSMYLNLTFDHRAIDGAAGGALPQRSEALS